MLKIHGCIDRSDPRELVITQEDYEEFASRRPAFTDRLRHDLIHKSLLFIGYSYRDPNIATVVVEARRLAGGATREHFLITKREVDPADSLRQGLWLKDLRRLGIRSALIKDYDELTNALNALALGSRGKSVFVTGSHTSSEPLASEIGKLLAAEKDVVLLDGQSEGVGREAANEFGSECLRRRADLRERIRFFPNPYAFNPAFSKDPSLLSTLRQWRAGLFRAAHVVVVFDGEIGTNAEMDVAKEQGCHIIPVPTKPHGLAEKLLSEPAIGDPLGAKYLAAAKGGTLRATDVIEAATRFFQP